MIIKLIIVDDEYLIRQLIRNGVEWKKLGIEVVGEMASAKEAMRQIPILKPDIVLTDICMPDVDGLEFAEQLKEQYPGIKIITVTGHELFEYARRGIRIGIDGYILKPISMEELEETVTQVRDKIRSERSRDVEIKKLSDFKKGTEEVVREYYLTRLLESDVHEDILSEQLKQELSVYKSDFIWIGVLEYNVGSLENGISHQNRKHREEWIRDYCIKQLGNILWLKDRFDRFVMLDQNPETDYSDFLRKLETNWRKNFDSPIYYGSDVIRKRQKSIHQAYESAVAKLNAALINSNNELDKAAGRLRNREKYSQLLSADKLKQLQYSMESSEPVRWDKLADEWFEEWNPVTTEDMELLRMQLMNTLFYVYMFSGNQYEELLQPVYIRFYDKSKRTKNIRELKNIFMEACGEFSGILKQGNQTTDTSNLIYSMKQYINENLDDPDFSLGTLAKEYYMNSSYLSRIFKKEVKSSFIEYLTDQRIDKAKQLLQYSDMKIYEVGERIGIYNANYFGILFKKKVGVTPVEYRKQFGK